MNIIYIRSVDDNYIMCSLSYSDKYTSEVWFSDQLPIPTVFDTLGLLRQRLMSLTRVAPKAFQSQNSDLITKAHEFSLSYNAEVLLIVGRESQYFAYSSFDRAQSVKTIMVLEQSLMVRDIANTHI